MKKILTTATVLAVLGITAIAVTDDPQKSFNGDGARYTNKGELIRPEGWRKWIYIGTPHDMNDGKAAFPEFHNVYVDPESFATFERTGKFADGTQIVKELVLVGSKSAVSGNGYFMGDFAGLEVAVKDSKRFAKEPGGWAYFSFGHQADYTKTAKMFDTESCNACHQASADTDFVFTQYYPVLRAAMPKSMRQAANDARAKAKKMDKQTMATAAKTMGVAKAGSTADEYAMKVFEWLAKGNYKGYAAESNVHPSSAGKAVHGDVRVFFNDKLNNSMRSGNKQHPVGSVAVKELHKNGKLTGWALSLKAREDDGKGNGWYWYEVLSTKDGKKPVAAGLGHQLCIGCHSPGRDFIRLGGLK